MFELFKNMTTPLCCLCGRRIYKEDVHKRYKDLCICRDCFKKLPQISANSMFEGPEHIDFVSSVFYYTKEYRSIFLDFKFFDARAIGHLIGMMASDYFVSHTALHEYDCIVPVPLSNARMRERGFNQAALLADHFSAGTGIPVLCALTRTVNRAPQSLASAGERHSNILGVYSVCRDVRGKRLIIADDIYTTGSTMNECAKVLIGAGAEAVCGISAAAAGRRTVSEASIF